MFQKFVISATLQKRFNDELLSPEQSERNVCEIVLKKEPGVGFGITIVGGECSNKLDLGVFVKAVAPGGPAFRDGHIKPGDQLIAINGQNLEGVQHHEAVKMIRYSGDTVRLLVSQVRAPKSIKRKVDFRDAIAKLRASNASPSDVEIYGQISDGDHNSQDNSDHFNVDNIPFDHVRDDPSVADVSTMSQIESIESEIFPVTDLPQDSQPIPAGVYHLLYIQLFLWLSNFCFFAITFKHSMQKWHLVLFANRSFLKWQTQTT